MSSLRRKRIQELLREEISKIVIEELADPRIGFTTVTGVSLDDEYKDAEVSVSILGPDSVRSATLAALNSSASHIRHKVSPYLKLRRAPRISFVFDAGVERSAHISDLIRQARSSDPAHDDDPAPPGEPAAETDSTDE